MAQKKKLQVFVSSTYTDLQEERQAAVQAILTAGHIPAGMELFAAGDETQMNVIKRWIDESDVYMLILGGRYGSIESKSQKSYIHLEYEYALEKGKPLFAVVINEEHLETKIKKHGSLVFEKEHPDKLKEFRELVCSKMVKFWSDPKDIKLAVMETMADFSNREELVGWISGDERINTGAVAEEIAKLAKENSELRERISRISTGSTKYNGLSFDEMYKLLSSKKLNEDSIDKNLLETANYFEDTEINLLHFLFYNKTRLGAGLNYAQTTKYEDEIIDELAEIGLVYRQDKITYLSDTGQQFLLRFRIQKNLN